MIFTLIEVGVFMNRLFIFIFLLVSIAAQADEGPTILKCSINFPCAAPVCDVDKLPEQRLNNIEKFAKDKEQLWSAVWRFEAGPASLAVSARYSEKSTGPINNIGQFRLLAKLGDQEVSYSIVDRVEKSSRFFHRFSFPTVQEFEGKKFETVAVSCKAE